jgi:biopolymer transport protein ExbD
MAMNIGSGGSSEPEVMMDINTTPLIDVMLVLLIMLIITIPIQTHAVKLNMPRPNPNQPLTKPVVVQIDIDVAGNVIWDGQVIPTRELLEQRFMYVAAQPDQPEIHLRPNKQSKYKVTALVMAAAQRLGVTKIGLVNT